MRILRVIYNGYYHTFAGTRLSRNPAFSAWVLCTLAALFYLYSTLLVVEAVFDSIFYEGAFPFLAVALPSSALLALLSDWNINWTWFGASATDMSESSVRRAKWIASAFLVGSWVSFIAINLVLYV